LDVLEAFIRLSEHNSNLFVHDTKVIKNSNELLEDCLDAIVL
jgi:hypothetical protein